MHKNVYGHIAQNTRKTIFLLLCFPAALCLIFYGLVLLITGNSPESKAEIMQLFLAGCPILIGVTILWSIISFLTGDKMMLGFAHAKELTEKSSLEYRKIRHTVENVALAAGLPTPKIYLIDDDSLNAFATGRSPDSASIALTTGLVKKLSPLELQAVIAHEMGHIGNRDTRLNMIIITCLGIFGLLADILIRIRLRGKDSAKVQLIIWLFWIGLMVFNWIIAPIIHFALSRTREFQADATAAFITRNPKALANALEKISADSRVEVLDKSPQMGTACIADPTAGSHQAFAGIGKTHPPIKERIKRLNEMLGF